LPTVGLQSTAFGFTTTPGPARLATWSIAAVLSVPLFEGGRRGGLVRERRGLEKEAAGALERARRDASTEVERSRRGVQVADTLLKVATSARDLAERTDQLTRRAFQVGTGTSLELVQSGAPCAGRSCPWHYASSSSSRRAWMHS
jgi:outer membrane protein TolC